MVSDSSTSSGSVGSKANMAAGTVRIVETDVVVIGGGGSGLAAAIEAGSYKRSVILIEKNEKLGGSTAWSMGSLTANCSPLQLQKGILDSPDDHFDDMTRFRELSGRIRRSVRPVPNNLEFRRMMVDNVGETVRWLMSMGIEFYGPLPEPPHRKPRMLIVLPNPAAYIYHMERAARKVGVDIRTNVRAKRLVVEDGRAAGVVCDTPEGPVEFRARGGIVVTTGDFAANREMKAQHISPEMASTQATNPTATGDGHQMILDIGGRIVDTGLHSSGIRFQPPPPKWITKLPPHRLFTKFMKWSMEYLPDWLVRPFVISFMTTVTVPSTYMFKSGAILINKRGERFTDELKNPSDNPTPVLAGQPDEIGYLLLDQKIAEKFSRWPFYVSTAPGIAYAFIPDYRRTRKDIFHEAPTLPALAAKLGIPASQLEQTVADYNRSLPSRPEAKDIEPLDRGPYIAMGPVRHYMNFADSGVAVDHRLQVLGPGDAPIAGLYAAGFTGMSGVILVGHGHHLGWAFTSGRFAGRYAAQRVVSADYVPPESSHHYQ